MTRARAFKSNTVSSPKKKSSGKPPTRSHRSLRKAIDRAVHDFVLASALSLMPKKGAEAMSQTVRCSRSMHDPHPCISFAVANRNRKPFQPVRFVATASVRTSNYLGSCCPNGFIATARDWSLRNRKPAAFVANRNEVRVFGRSRQEPLPGAVGGASPSTMITSAGASVCSIRLVTNRSMSWCSLRTVDTTLTVDLIIEPSLQLEVGLQTYVWATIVQVP